MIKFKNLNKDAQNLVMWAAGHWDCDIESVIDDYYELFSEFNTEISRSSYRWWDNIVVQGLFGDAVYQWDWASANGDSSLEDLGWEFDWNSINQINIRDTITDTQILNFLEMQNNKLLFYDGWSNGIREWGKDQIITLDLI